MHPAAPRKRPYQPDIAAFFPRDETTLPIREDRTSSKARARVSPQPQLPIYVQSSLLNVGMRIRKAVPEGYRRQKMLEAEVTMEDKENHGSKAISGWSSTPARELQPFAYCPSVHGGGNALHEIGGWSAQPTSHVADHDEEIPSSQESNSSTSSIPAKAKGKRIFEDDDADDESESINIASHQNALSLIMQERPWARSRGLRVRRRTFPSRITRTTAPVPDFIPDFEEADFLRPREEDNMDIS